MKGIDMNMQQIILTKRPVGLPNESHFSFEDFTLSPLKEGEVHVKGLYYSVDPYMRGRMNEGKSYVEPFQVGKPLSGGIVATVLESRSNQFKVGDYVLGNLPWATEAVVSAKHLEKIDPVLAPVSYALGLLGMPGLTAYFGFLDICKPKAGECVVVSGAAGAVGLVVGQIAKIKGCRVIGIASSEDKINSLKNEYGFDDAINYKTTEDMAKEIAKLCPNGVDIYFDNVGGDITDAVVKNINFHARIALCGQISMYNEEKTQYGPRLFPILLTRSVLMKGFIVSNYQSQYPEALKQLSTWLQEGKLKFTETILEGFDQLPKALLGLFSGSNSGKMLVKAVVTH